MTRTRPSWPKRKAPPKVAADPAELGTLEAGPPSPPRARRRRRRMQEAEPDS
jgi:hypothetical protein